MTKAHAVSSRAWWVVDATGKPLGRLASEVAHVLRGKHKPTYTPHEDTGDFVIVVNADKVRSRATSSTRSSTTATRASRAASAPRATATCWRAKPRSPSRRPCKGMLPKSVLGREMLTKLKIYATPDHPHAAQKPQPLPSRPAPPPKGSAKTSAWPLPTRAPTPPASARPPSPASGSRPGTGTIVVNGLPADEYFERETSRMIIRQALELIEAQDQFDVWATCTAAARRPRPRRCATASRARSSRSTPRSAAAVKRAGFLTRDARKKERKKYGQPGARKRFQYSKR